MKRGRASAGQAGIGCKIHRSVDGIGASRSRGGHSSHNGGVNEQAELRPSCRAFIAAAFDVLREEHVIPTPIFHPYVAVGRDYFGDTVRAVAEYHTLETQLNDAYPERFAGPVPRPHAEFATTYIFSFLEACVARCARDGNFDADSPAVDESIDELLAVLGRLSDEIVCCRHVSHLTTTSGAEVQIG